MHIFTMEISLEITCNGLRRGYGVHGIIVHDLLLFPILMTKAFKMFTTFVSFE